MVATSRRVLPKWWGHGIRGCQKRYANLTCIGLADGAKNNWTNLEGRTTVHILDFFQADEHLAEVSAVMHKIETKRKQWLHEVCHNLKHESNGAKYILRELNEQRKKLSGSISQIHSTPQSPILKAIATG